MAFWLKSVINGKHKQLFPGKIVATFAMEIVTFILSIIIRQLCFFDLQMTLGYWPKTIIRFQLILLEVDNIDNVVLSQLVQDNDKT